MDDEVPAGAGAPEPALGAGAPEPVGARPVATADRTVPEVMTQPVVAVLADTTTWDALTAMVGTGLRHLVVVDPADHCLGVLSDRAVAAAWAHDPVAFGESTVVELVDPQPAVLPVDATVRQAAAVMRARQVDAVVVVDDSAHPLGIVTSSDLVALLAAG
ncbi:MAG TPA: CBS domain-containing protein [Micromonosporaceae bacterium]